MRESRLEAKIRERKELAKFTSRRPPIKPSGKTVPQEPIKRPTVAQEKSDKIFWQVCQGMMIIFIVLLFYGIMRYILG